MTKEEVARMYEKIETLIGKREDISSMNGRNDYDKMREKLKAIVYTHGEKALSLEMVQQNGFIKFVTTSGKRAIWERNNGMEQRSRYCGTLYIDGKTVFTSGTIAKVMDYVINN